MLVGTAKIDITPPIGTWLVGYLDRASVSNSIADPLHATALAFRSGADTFVLVSCELLAVHSSLVAEVRALVSAAAGIAKEAIWISASHTHSGPPSQPTAEINAIERVYIATLPGSIAGVALKALDDLEPVEFRHATVPVVVGENRRRIENGAAVMEPAYGRPIDRDVSLLDIHREGGPRKALLVVVACHPVTIGRDNLSVSGDYPGALCRRLEARLGGTAIFAMGASGDVNPIHGPALDTRGAERTAETLLGPIEAALETAVPLGTSELAFSRMLMDFPVAPSRIDRGPGEKPHIEHLVQVQGKRWPEIDRIMDRRHPWRPAAPGNYHEQEWEPGEIAAARIGSVALVALPVELFSELGLEIKRRSPFPSTIVISQTNGALGYLAPPFEHAHGGYEICESPLFYRTRGPLSPAAAALAVDGTLALLAGLAGTSN